MNKTVLVTAVGSFSADAVIASLKKAGYRVVGCDIYPRAWHPCAQVLDAFFQAPYARPEASYVAFLAEVCRTENVNYLIPLTDLEIDVLNGYRSVFTDLSVCLCMQGSDTLSVARDKYRLYARFGDDPRVASIPTYLCPREEIAQPEFPYIAKPCNGRSSEGLARIEDAETLRRYLRQPGYVVQRFMPGAVFTVDYVRSADSGFDVAIPRQELLRTKNGAGVTVEMIRDPELERTVSYIGTALGVHGCVNMEFIRTDGTYYLIDVNPRFSAGVAFSVKAGYDMIRSHMDCFCGRPILPPVRIKRQIIAKRYYEETLWLEE